MIIIIIVLKLIQVAVFNLNASRLVSKWHKFEIAATVEALKRKKGNCQEDKGKVTR